MHCGKGELFLPFLAVKHFLCYFFAFLLSLIQMVNVTTP